MRRALPLLLLSLLFAEVAKADFRSLTREVEQRLGVKKTWIPFWGVARLFLRAAQPATGIYDIDFAVFENAPRLSNIDLDTLMRRHVGPEFRPLVRVLSHRKGESVFIYARPRPGDRLDLVFMAHDHGETVLARVATNVAVLGRHFDRPGQMTVIARRPE